MYFSNYPHFTNDTLGLRESLTCSRLKSLFISSRARNSTPASWIQTLSLKHYAKMPLYNLEGISTNKRKHGFSYLKNKMFPSYLLMYFLYARKPDWLSLGLSVILSHQLASGCHFKISQPEALVCRWDTCTYNYTHTYTFMCVCNWWLR